MAPWLIFFYLPCFLGKSTVNLCRTSLVFPDSVPNRAPLPSITIKPNLLSSANRAVKAWKTRCKINRDWIQLIRDNINIISGEIYCQQLTSQRHHWWLLVIFPPKNTFFDRIDFPSKVTNNTSQGSTSTFSSLRPARLVQLFISY